MKISDLINGIKYETVTGDLGADVLEVIYDTRRVKAGSLFVCIKGSAFDSHDALKSIINNGAGVVVIEKPLNEIKDFDEIKVSDAFQGVTIIKVQDSRRALSVISANYFGNPARKLITIGITGTKGKTTTTYMVKKILDTAGIPTGLIGTVETIVGDKHIPSANTTPESYLIQKYFKEMADIGTKAVVMEVSSQGLMQGRVYGIDFDYGIFTNLEPDHIGENEHKDFNEYMYWKSTLFKMCKVGIFNTDSEHIEGILSGATCKRVTYGFNEKADYRASDTSFLLNHGELDTKYRLTGKINSEIMLNMPGIFSVYNSLAALSVCSEIGVDTETIKKALLNVYVNGRTEIVDIKSMSKYPVHFAAMIDYAHNGMALKSLLETLRAYSPGRLVCLFGCGGNRSKSRRYEMGEVAARLSDFTIVTSDNPRDEDPNLIIKDIVTGINKYNGKYIEIPDRKEAVKYAFLNAKDGDVIILAGKGHEDYQEINGVKYHMNERELIESAMVTYNRVRDDEKGQENKKEEE